MKETRFKDTEIGLVPEEWEMISLGDVGEVRMCKRIMKFQTAEKGDIPFFKISTLGGRPDAFISRILYESYKEKYSYPKRGDILLSAAGTIGRAVIFDGKPSYFQDSNIVWIENTESLLLNNLLYYIYRDLSWVTESGTIPRIYNSIVRSINFPIPINKEEQSRIAAALTSIDDLISALDKLIEKKKNIKQGSMQLLLTGKKRLKGLTDPWVEKQLGTMGCTFSGLTGKTKEDFGIGNARYITFLNVLSNPILKRELFEEVVVRDGEKQNSCHKGDLFFNTTSETPEEVGICAVLDTEMESLYLNSFCFGYRLKDDRVVPEYLAYYFRSNEGRKMMTLLAQGVTRYNISKYAFNKAKLLMPPTALEQKAIVDVLKGIDKEIEALEIKKAKYEQIKQGMMQQLLTGKIRLIEGPA